MARPPARELTERELDVMHVFWSGGDLTAAEARDELAEGGRDLAYTTVATQVRILVDKGFPRPAQRRTSVPISGVPDVRGRLPADAGGTARTGCSGVLASNSWCA